MIKLIANNEREDGFTSEVHIEGNGLVLAQQLAVLFDRVYEKAPKVFETALLICKYTEDHT